jgi:cell division protein ZapA (FtsZ GTPase activity inhibitor)
MQELQKIEEGFREIHANTVVSMAQIMALTELVEEVAQRVGVTSIHGLSIKDALRQRTDELSQRLLQGLERPPHPAVKLSVNPLDWPKTSPAKK